MEVAAFLPVKELEAEMATPGSGTAPATAFPATSQDAGACANACDAAANSSTMAASRPRLENVGSTETNFIGRM